MTWRTIPSVNCRIDHPENGETSDILKGVRWSLNLALLKTFKGQKYKKFAILYTIIHGKKESIFEIICPEVELLTNFKKFVDKTYSVNDADSVIKDTEEKISKVKYRLLPGKTMAATVVYDEQWGEITLGEEPLQMDVTTTSGLLFYLASISKGNTICDDGLIFEHYNLRKLVFYIMDTQTVDLSRIRVDIDDYEKWDYYYPEYDREEEINKKKYEAKIEKEFHKNQFKLKELKLPNTDEEFLEIIDKIITDFKNVVENKAYELLWDKNGAQRDEKSCQILFDVFVKNYCKGVGIDLTREVETGRGPVDFRFSSSVHYVAHIELKKENNSRLVHGLIKQLPTYMNSEEVKFGIFIIFDFGTKDISGLKENLEEQRVRLEKDKGIKLRIIYIDARSKLSASKI